MAQSIRWQTRYSLLALLLANLREGLSTTANFPTYPNSQNVWTFTDGLLNLWRIAVIDDGAPILSPGVTVVFGADRSENSQSQPAVYDTTVSIHIRVPLDFNGDSTAMSLAQQIDEALDSSNGQVAITDFFTTPGTPIISSSFLDWQMSGGRGAWEEKGNSKMTDLVLSFPAQYSLSKGFGL